MRGKNVLSNLTAYSLAHALVDGACAAMLYALLASGRGAPQNLALFILLYDVLAFSTQPLFGLLVDRLQAPAQMAAAGLALVAAALLMMKVPLLAAVTAGFGNAIFHVGGGFASLRMACGKASLPGIFVAPGALGLTLGLLIGKGGGFVAWPFIVLLLVLAGLILFLPKAEAPAAPLVAPANLPWFELLIGLLLASVAIRGLVGQSQVLPWKSDPALLLALTLAVVLGKALGGLLADRLGWEKVALSGLAIAAPLLAFFPGNPALVMLGTFLFNLSMPVTLICLANLLPEKPGFAFGLTALALIAGALPAFTPLVAFTGQAGWLFAAGLVSLGALYGGLRLYRRYYGENQGG